MKAKHWIYVAIILAFIAILMISSESGQRTIKSITSNTNGLYRIVTVYDYEGDVIAVHKGKIDVETNDSKVLFDLDGKRYIYYNCLVEIKEVSAEEITDSGDET